MWALALLIVGLAAHTVLAGWGRAVIGRGPVRTLLLAGGGILLTLWLFAPREYFGYSSFELAVVALGAAIFVALLVIARAVAGLRGAAPVRRLRRNGVARDAAPPVTSAEHALHLPAALETTGRRATFVRLAGGVSWAASAGVLGWGAARGRHDFRIVEVVARIPGLPRALDGYTLVQISDLHAGEFLGETELARGLAQVTRARGDLLVVTGDYVDFDPAFAPMVGAQLARVAPRDGVIGVLGNHDYYDDAGAVRRALTSAGVDVLVNQSRVIRAGDGGGFVLVGLDDLSAVRRGGMGPDLALAVAGAPRDLPRILLAHQPPQFDDAAGQVALQLSGHTHGYQLDFAAAAGRLAHRYVAGRYEKAGSVLWVNSGFGVTGPPTRVGVPPEITRIVLAAS